MDPFNPMDPHPPERVWVLDTVTREVSTPTAPPPSCRFDHVTPNGYCIGFDHEDDTPVAILNGHLVPRHVVVWHPDPTITQMNPGDWYDTRSRLKQRPPPHTTSRLNPEHLRKGRREVKQEEEVNLEESEIYEEEEDEVEGDECEDVDLDLDDYDEKENIE